MVLDSTTSKLYDLFSVAQELGSISPWTLRKHIAQGTVKATRLGRRVFLRADEIERIRLEGLPPLRTVSRGAALKTSERR